VFDELKSAINEKALFYKENPNENVAEFQAVLKDIYHFLIDFSAQSF
jgi:hypothetical protein